MTPVLPLTDFATIMVLSPHLDDSVLSCGALIADAHHLGVDVVVVTVFNGRPVPPVSAPASRFHARCGHTDDNAMDEREIEDAHALGVVGARTERLYLPEALYRKDQDGKPLYDSDLAIFMETLRLSDDELRAVECRIAECVDDVDPDLVLAPLGIGGHVDHLLVSVAAQRLDRDVLYYEDVPYVLYERCKNWRDGMAGHAPRVHVCTAEGWSAKVSGIECHRSQHSVLWYSPDTWREDLDSYARASGGGRQAERFWSRHDR
ncbi:MAG: PIG-L deacetylase family protein [Micromonosporaceae bacterium]